MSGARSARIADQIQRELAGIVRLELRDPRVGLVTFTGVELSRDQSHAKVFFTVLGAGPVVEDALHGLQHAAGFLRSQLAHRLSTRSVPELHFAYDESVERGMRLSKLIDEAVGHPPGASAAGKPAAADKPAADKPAPRRGKR